MYRGKRRPNPGRVITAEDEIRSSRRARSTARKTVLELAPSALVTFTTRETMSMDDLLTCWTYFTRLMREARIDFEYVAVPERHPSNPAHLHLHVAYRGRTPFDIFRRFWHMALEARHGRKIRCILRGSESPGNIDVRKVKARHDMKRMRKIAGYITSYITKETIAEFGRRKYWPSKGIEIKNAQVFWLNSLSQAEAIKEACQMLGQWDGVAGLPAQRMFIPCDRVAFCVIDPDLTPSSPF